MINRPTIYRVFYALAHPMTIIAVLVLLVNDHILRQLWPSWWTGKLGDVAWLIFAPLMGTAVLALLLPGMAKREERLGQLAFLFTGLGFALAKTLPFFHGVVVTVWSYLAGGPIGLRRDPTDLLALPALGVGWYIWQQSQQKTTRRLALGVVMLPLMVLTTVANSPTWSNFGINAVALCDSGFVAQAVGIDAYYSADGGLTWETIPLSSVSSCSGFASEFVESSWEIVDLKDPQILYRITQDKDIIVSRDGGTTWEVQWALVPVGEAQSVYYFERTPPGNSLEVKFRSYPSDIAVDMDTGVIVAAMNHEGVLVKTAEGEWRQVGVGPYQPVKFNDPRVVGSLLRRELLSGGVLAGLLVCTLAMRVKGAEPKRFGTRFCFLTWLVWFVFPAIYAPSPIIRYGMFSGMFSELVFTVGRYGGDTVGWIFLFLFAIFVFLSDFGWIFVFPSAFGVIRLLTDGADFQTAFFKPRNRRWILGTAVSGTLLFFLPYLLWTQGVFTYHLASLLAITLALSVLALGFWGLSKRHFPLQ